MNGTDSARLRLKVVPGASASSIAGWLGEELKVRVSAPPEKGKANKAVIGLLSRALDLPISAISIVSGETSAHKVVQIGGLSESQVRTRLK